MSRERMAFETVGSLVLLMVLSLAAIARAEPDPFVGAFADEKSKMTVDLKPGGDPGSYTGTIHLGEKTFPLTARREDERLAGTFESGGQSFGFTAKMAGGHLELLTGNSKYSLTSAANPLDAGPGGPPAAPNPLEAPARPAQPMSAEGGDVAKWRKQAEAGDVQAMMNLGVALFKGEGVERNYQEADRLFMKAAAAGNHFAMENLAVASYNGFGVEKSEAAALAWHRKAARAGDGHAAQEVGWYYQKGMGGVEADGNEALKWYKKAVELGYGAANADVGFCYLNGIGAEKDAAEAVKWFRKGTEAGDPMAMNNLAVCYAKGLGVDANPEEAAKWKKRAQDAKAGIEPPAALPPGVKGTSKELAGSWAISGNVLNGDKMFIDLAPDGQMTLRNDSGSSSSTGEPNWTYADGKLHFKSGSQFNGLHATGAWKVQWVGPDDLSVTDANGNALTLKRVAPPK